MPSPRIHLPGPPPNWDELRTELLVPAAFLPEVLTEAEAVTTALPDLDLTDVPFLTIDPVGSVDLD